MAGGPLSGPDMSGSDSQTGDITLSPLTGKVPRQQVGRQVCFVFCIDFICSREVVILPEENRQKLESDTCN